MEQLAGGATRFRHQHYRRSPPAADRFLSTLKTLPSSSAASQLELSEHDIFSTPSGGSSPSPTHQYFAPNPGSGRSASSNHYGILAALNGSIKSQSGSRSDTRPVFNHKASASASISSSSSTSPATSTSSRIMIPRPPPPQADRVRYRHQSAPVNVPVIPAGLRRRVMELDDALSEGEEEDKNGVVLPPHEVVDARHSPMLACSVLEGAGRTLKGRDLRQVRNAVWRKTGFID
ncbi:uncharacterized protein LOC105170029 [Sesamum indicum]|uniref:Uncharacterized protein LOC105170029 n=1 Tax=Sesamum indicum TaxID=4182 RepID=A0A6I9TVC2_SESIN|nr:uncharacterized protein LOC105170029 [Sesamum indicum]